jgi:hypothetical protein
MRNVSGAKVNGLTVKELEQERRIEKTSEVTVEQWGGILWEQDMQ